MPRMRVGITEFYHEGNRRLGAAKWTTYRIANGLKLRSFDRLSADSG